MEQLTFMFKDNDWRRKLIVGSLISIVPLLNLVTLGYSLDVVRAIKNDTVPWLPDWSTRFEENFKEGAKIGIALLLYLIPALITFWAYSLTASHANYLAFRTGTYNSVTAFELNIRAIILLVIGVAYLVGLVAWVPAMITHFETHSDFKSLFDIVKIVPIVIQGATYIRTMVITFVIFVPVAYIGYGILALIPCLGWIGAMVLVAFTPLYASLILAYTSGIVTRVVAGKEPVVPPTPIPPPKPKPQVLEAPHPTAQAKPSPIQPSAHKQKKGFFDDDDETQETQ